MHLSATAAIISSVSDKRLEKLRIRWIAVTLNGLSHAAEALNCIVSHP
jgi:hypothetical protein